MSAEVRPTGEEAISKGDNDTGEPALTSSGDVFSTTDRPLRVWLDDAEAGALDGC